MRKCLIYFFSIFKSLIYNIHLFGLRRGIKLPLIINVATKIKVPKFSLEIPEGKRVVFWLGGSMGISAHKESNLIINKGKIIFKGDAFFGEGASVRIDNGKLIIGNNFLTNKNFYLSNNLDNKIGEGVMVGWNVTILDGDGHEIIGSRKNDNINIGNNVWICSEVHLLKGSNIGNGSVVGYRSLVTSSLSKNEVLERCLIAGNPARVVKREVTWNR